VKKVLPVSGIVLFFLPDKVSLIIQFVLVEVRQIDNHYIMYESGLTTLPCLCFHFPFPWLCFFYKVLEN